MTEALVQGRMVSMTRSFKSYGVVLAAVFAFAIACGNGDSEPTATPEPTPTPVPSFDLAALGIDGSDLDALGITEADVQCLVAAVEAEVLEQLFADGLTPADALSVVPALKACDVDLAGLIEGADDQLAESVGDDYPGLDNLPFTAEQLDCLSAEIGLETINALAADEVSPLRLLSFVGVLSTCGVDLSELAN